MKQQVNPKIFFAIIAALVVALGAIAARQFGLGKGSDKPLTPEQAGLGKPMYPASTAPVGGGAQTGSAEVPVGQPTKTGTPTGQ